MQKYLHKIGVATMGICFIFCGMVGAQSPPSKMKSEEKPETGERMEEEDEIIEFLSEYMEPERVKKLKIIKRRRGDEFLKEREDEVIEFLSEYMEPERLEKLKVTDPMAYKHILRHTLKEKRHLERLKELDPERYELKKEVMRLEIKSKNLAYDYKAPENKKKQKKIESELKSILTKLFDLKEKDKKFELKRLEKEITKLRDIMAEREKHKGKIIERHLNELLEEKEYLRW